MDSNNDSELEPQNWPIEDEVHLLYSTLDNKAVGVDRHFQMAIVWSKFTHSSNKLITSDILWKKLNSLYNLKAFDEAEMIPFNTDEEDFHLPSELIPEYIVKNISDDEKKNVDFSGHHRKYISVVDTDDDDFEKSQFKLKGSEKMKWFEHPTYYKSNDRPSKKINDTKLKSEPNDSIVIGNTETKKVIRQYGKAGKVSSGSLLTVSVLEKQSSTAKSAETITSVTRSRKASSASQDTVSSSENEKTESTVSAGDENSKNPKRRFSQRVSSTSESKSDALVKPAETHSKAEPKRKVASRR